MRHPHLLLGAALSAMLVGAGPASHGDAAAAAAATEVAAPVATVSAPADVTARLQRLLTAARAAATQVAEAAMGQDPQDGRQDRRSTRDARRPKGAGKPSDRRRLSLVRSITGGITPKSIVSAQNGKIFAMNMTYGHSITVFNRRFKRIKVIDDTVNLSRLGHPRYRKKVRGGPVEAAVDPVRKRLYVSNYSMYGPGFRSPGWDECTDSDPIDRSFVYEISTRTMRKTGAFEVGRVPKYLAVTPNGRYLLVGNWCSWDISVVDLRQRREVRRIEAGVAPRGIAFSPNSRTAYVTLVGDDRVLVIDLRRFRVRREIGDVGTRPRHLVVSPSGRYLFITSQGKDSRRKADGQVLKYDIRRKRVVATSEALVEPRTTVASEDGRSLYVVDYYPGTLVKLRARDLQVLQEVWLGYHPIGVTYDTASDMLWVAGYGGNVWVLKDR